MFGQGKGQLLPVISFGISLIGELILMGIALSLYFDYKIARWKKKIDPRLVKLFYLLVSLALLTCAIPLLTFIIVYKPPNVHLTSVCTFITASTLLLYFTHKLVVYAFLIIRMGLVYTTGSVCGPKRISSMVLALAFFSTCLGIVYVVVSATSIKYNPELKRCDPNLSEESYIVLLCTFPLDAAINLITSIAFAWPIREIIQMEEKPRSSLSRVTNQSKIEAVKLKSQKEALKRTVISSLVIFISTIIFNFGNFLVYLLSPNNSEVDRFRVVGLIDQLVSNLCVLYCIKAGICFWWQADEHSSRGASWHKSSQLNSISAKVGVTVTTNEI